MKASLILQKLSLMNTQPKKGKTDSCKLGKWSWLPWCLSPGTERLCTSQGGVLFITSRILVVDLLRAQCPVEKVNGILVLNGHRYC